MPADRRDFLGALIGASLLGGPDALRSPSRPLSDSPWDLSWTGKLKGDHRAVFDWYQPAGSAGLWRAKIWKDQVAEAFGVTAESVSSVLVIRHSAIPMIMSDDFWARNELGKKRKIKDEMSGKTATLNPHRKGIEGFLSTGGIVLGCGFAFGAMVYADAQRLNKKPDEVRPEVLTQVIPGIVIQPSGFFALIEAQRNGCGLFPADALSASD
jgi:hypothetical protein